MNPAPVCSHRYVATLWIVATFLAYMTFISPGTHLEFVGGMDHSWAYALNYGFHNGLVMGRDLYFTFGPLGFLEHTRLVSNNMLYVSFAFSFLVSAGLYAALLHLAWLAGNTTTLRYASGVIAMLLCLVSFPEMQRLLMLGYVLLFLHWLTARMAYAVLLSLSVTLCVLIKFSYGAAAGALWLSYLFLHYRVHRDKRVVQVAAASLVLSYLLLWLVMYGSLSGSIGYLVGELYISRGNAVAMAMNPENNWLAIALFYLALCLAACILHRDGSGRYRLLPWCFLPPLLVWTKYTFAQEQYLHFVPILDFAVFGMGIFLVIATRWLYKLQLAALMLCAIVAWQGMHTDSVGKPDYVNVPHITFEQPEVARYRFHLKKLFSIWRTAEKERLQPLLLPTAMREMIGDASVDIYPWELTIAAVNELNWHPRPSFQIYISYVPFLDRKNRDFFNSDKAPQYIIWHHHETQDVMNRYALSSEPETLEAILNHYRLQYCDGIFCLWKHSDKAQMTSLEESERDDIPWNTWVSVPERRGALLRASLDIRRSLAGLLNLVLWKEGGVEIDYKLRNGEIKTHDLLVDNAVSGVWISPYVESYLGSSSAHTEVLSIQQLQRILSQPAARGQLEKIEPTLTSYRVTGWALMPLIDTREQQQFVLLYNSDKAFLVSAGKYDRSDVTEYFARQGQPITGQCGFLDEIGTQVPDGNYKVRLAVQARGQWAVLPDQGFSLNINRNERSDAVREIRVRTIRPWAFATRIHVRWQQLYFAETVPW